MASLPVFSVRRSNPSLVSPAEPTPRELKILSAIDNMQELRFQFPILFFHRYDPTAPSASHNPAATIRNAISKALVPYYPLAGRLRESGNGHKLVVDCTGEGVLFIEAESDIRLEQLGDRILPPFPYSEEVLHDVEGSSGILHSPLMLIQVTQFSCGGFVFGIRVNHMVCDAKGLMQFLTAVSELATGMARPSVLPVWQRDLLDIQSSVPLPSVPTGVLRLYDEEAPDEKAAHFTMLEDEGRAVSRYFFFGRTELSCLRKQLPPRMQSSYSTFLILAACLWRCRTIALRPEPDRLVRLIVPVDVRSLMTPPLAAGYYGNCLVFIAAVSQADDLCQRSWQYAVELLRKAISEVTNEFVQAQVNILAGDTSPTVAMVWSYMLTNLTHAGFDRVDFGWGPPSFGGLASGLIYGTALMPIRNNEGKLEGISVEMRLPSMAMDRFTIEIKRATTGPSWKM